MLNAFSTAGSIAKAAKQYDIPLVSIDYKDETPVMNQDGGYVINLASSGMTGTHWVAAWKEGDETFYYDPFGLAPPTETLDRMTTSKRYINTQQIQDIDTGYCGLYVLEWLYDMSQTKVSNRADFRRYKKRFSTTTSKNAGLLKGLYRRKTNRS